MPLTDRELSKLHTRYPKKRAAITGAGSGLGEALALELARHGWTLWLNDKDSQLLGSIHERCTALGAQVYSTCFDVASLPDFEWGATEFLHRHGSADLVFTCAGIGVGGPFIDCDPDHIREVVDVNLLGTLWAGKIFLPAMTQEGKGAFVTIASAAAFHGLPHLSAYAATKAGVVQFSETLRSEMTPHGVDVITKMTTFYTSSIAEHTRGPADEREKARSLVQMAPWSSEEVADALLKTVQQRSFYMVAPGQARFLWRFKRLFPERYLRLMPALFPKLEAKLLEKAAERQASASPASP